MKRPPALTERPLRAASSMNPGAGAGRTSLVKPEPRAFVDLQTAGGGGGGGTKIALGPVPLFAALAPLPDYSWIEVTGVGALAEVYRFQVSSSSTINWAVQVRTNDAGAGELMFEAIGIGETIYQCSWPWIYDSGGATSIFVGIRNISGLASDFNLVELRAIAFG